MVTAGTALGKDWAGGRVLLRDVSGTVPDGGAAATRVCAPPPLLFVSVYSQLSCRSVRRPPPLSRTVSCARISKVLFVSLRLTVSYTIKIHLCSGFFLIGFLFAPDMCAISGVHPCTTTAAETKQWLGAVVAKQKPGVNVVDAPPSHPCRRADDAVRRVGVPDRVVPPDRGRR